MAETGGADIETNTLPGQLSTLMSDLTNGICDLISCFDKINKNEFNDTSLDYEVFPNYTFATNKGKNSGQFPLERRFRFCRTFKEITKQLGFHVILKAADIQNIITQH